MRVAVDAMGGDLGPRVIVDGALQGLVFFGPDDELHLYGDEAQVQQFCADLGVTDQRVRIIHCAEVVGMDESPVDAIRQKRDSSMMRMAQGAGKGEVDAIISAGNTGAFAAACQLRIRPIEGVTRPGIGVMIPTFYGPVLICDAGANVSPRPRHLYEYAHIATCYARQMLNRDKPRIGLVSIGEEEGKGNALVREAGALIRQDESLEYVGHVEGGDVFGGKCEIIICDGFTGNIILKLTEGLAEGLFKTINRELHEEAPDRVADFEPVVDRIWKRHDFKEYGGAPLLGLNSLAIICHGRSDQRAIYNAVRVASEQCRTGLKEAIARRIREKAAPAPEEAS